MAPIDTVLQKGHSSYQKDYLPKMTPQKNGIFTNTLLVFWSNTNIRLIEATPTTIKHRRVPAISFWSGKKSTLKSHDHESEPYNKFKNSFQKSLSSVLGK